MSKLKSRNEHFFEYRESEEKISLNITSDYGALPDSIPTSSSGSSYSDPISSITTNVEHINCLVVGPSRVGKSTFMEVLGNLDHSESVSEVGSVTKEANEYQYLVTAESGRNCFVRFIDTPGFGDTSGVSDHEIENLISSFVKKGFKNLSMVLVTIPFNRGIDAGQAQLIMNCLEFLGETLSPVTSILYTFSENTNEEQRLQYHSKVCSAEHTALLAEFCTDEFFSTGMCTVNTPAGRQRFRKEQKHQVSEIIEYAMESEPVDLVGEKYAEAASKFVVFDNAGKDAVSLKWLLPTIADLSKRIVSSRDKLTVPQVGTAEYKEYESVLSLTEDVSLGNIDENIVEWSRVQAQVEGYMMHGNVLELTAEKARTVYKQLHQVDKRIKKLKFALVVAKKVERKTRRRKI